MFWGKAVEDGQLSACAQDWESSLSAAGLYGVTERKRGLLGVLMVG